MSFLLYLAGYSLYPAKFYIKKSHNREKEIKLFRGIETESIPDSTISSLITGRKECTKSASSQSMRTTNNLSSPNANDKPTASAGVFQTESTRHLRMSPQLDYPNQRTLA